MSVDFANGILLGACLMGFVGIILIQIYHTQIVKIIDKLEKELNKKKYKKARFI